MGVTAFTELKQKVPVSTNNATMQYVNCIAMAITQALPTPYQNNWEVVVFADNTANAFALPGRKIGVNTGLLKIANNQHQLATVIGHEIAHVIAQHGNERLSTNFATQTGLQVLESMSGEASPSKSLLFAALGLGAQFGVTLPFGRIQETEADLLGLEYMARAGFKPQASIQLWQNMSAGSNGSPPEFLSTHPSHEQRISQLKQQIPQVMPLYRQATASGKQPACQ